MRNGLRQSCMRWVVRQSLLTSRICMVLTKRLLVLTKRLPVLDQCLLFRVVTPPLLREVIQCARRCSKAHVPSEDPATPNAGDC